VNFINVEDLVVFAKTMLGVKWSVYFICCNSFSDVMDATGTCTPARKYFK
jgi:hypothetical protein